MAKQSSGYTSTASLKNLCLCKLIEELHHFSPEMLSLIPPVQRKELLLYYPVVSICHLEQTCAFDDINSDVFWNELLWNQNGRHRLYYDIKALKVLSSSYNFEDCYSSYREKYFTFLTAVIFSGDRFFGHYANRSGGIGKPYYKGGTQPPEQRRCHNDIVNYLVAYRKPDVVIEEVDSEERFSSSSETDSSEDVEDFKKIFPIPIRNVCGRGYGELYEDATKGQYVHSCYSHYVSKKNHYRLSDEDAVALMMNKCSYYPKKLLIHEYEHVHWTLSDDSLVQLLTQFFSKLESISLHFREGKVYDCIHGNTTIDDSKNVFESVLNCCFSSPVLSSLVIAGPIADDKTALFSTFTTKPCPCLKMLDINCWSEDRNDVCQLEAFANIIASCSQLTEICLCLDTDLEIGASSFSCLYSSLISFVQRPEFSKLSLHENFPLSSHLRLLLDAFLKTPCSQSQEIHLYPYDVCEPHGSRASPIYLPVGDSKVPSGALEYKSLFIYESCRVTVDFCEWLCSHQPLVLKAFYFDADFVSIGEYGTLAPPEAAFPVQLLCDNALFQTRELLLPIFHEEFPSHVLQNLLQHQQLTVLSLVQPQNFQQAEKPKPWNITSILSLQIQTLTELTISSRNSYMYISIETSADMEHFSDALFSLRNYEIFSLCIPVLWKKEDTDYIDSLYNSWLKHGCRKLKSFEMGGFEYGFVLTDELAMKLVKMGLVIQQTYVRLSSSPSVSAPSPSSDKHTFSVSSLHNLCLCKLIEDFHCYSPEMLSLLPPVQRKQLLLYCPVVSICHLEQTCAFDGIDSDIFWDELLKIQKNGIRYFRFYDINAHQALLRASRSCEYANYFSSNREKYFTYLTAMIFSGDRFSGHYAMFTSATGTGRDYYDGGIPPPGERSCPPDIVNYLVAHRKPDIFIKNVDYEERVSERDTYEESDDEEFYYPLPIRDMFGQKYGKLYKESTKGQHVHSCYSQYILKENHYRLSDEDAVTLMMNECNYYPKELFIHEYEHMHWKWSDDELQQLLTQFFSKLESLSLHFRQKKDIDDYTYESTTGKDLELVLNCCFSSPVLSSLVIADLIRYDCDRTALFSTLATNPCLSLKTLDIHCCRDTGDEICHLEAFANIIASHNLLTEICIRLHSDLKVVATSLSCLYTSLINFVQRQEFSKLSLHGQVPFSSHLRLLLDTFLKTPCSQLQEIHLYPSNPACSNASPIHLPADNNKIPSGALEYKSLFVHEHCKVTVDFYEWLCSHQPLALKVFHFDADLVNIGEYGQLVPSETPFHIQRLCDNALFQTQGLLLPIFNDLPSHALQNLLCRLQLTNLSLTPTKHFQGEQEPQPCSINDITSILSLQRETLIELTMPMDHYRCYVSFESLADIERFGDALFSLRNCEIFSLCIPVVWKTDDAICVDSLYNSWLKHGCRKLKSLQLGSFKNGFVLTDELARKLDKMGLVIHYVPPRSHSPSSEESSV